MRSTARSVPIASGFARSDSTNPHTPREGGRKAVDSSVRVGRATERRTSPESIAVVGLLHGEPLAVTAFAIGLAAARTRGHAGWSGVMKPPPPSVPLPGDRGSVGSVEYGELIRPSADRPE